MRQLSILLGIAFLIVACGDETISPGTADDPTTTTSSTAPPTTDQGGPTNPVVTAAIADLADREGVDPSIIEVETFQRGVWSDGSLGCPEEGMMYTQALVIGTRTALRIEDALYLYHQGGDGDPFLCDSPDPNSFRGEDGDVLLPPPGYNE